VLRGRTATISALATVALVLAAAMPAEAMIRTGTTYCPNGMWLYSTTIGYTYHNHVSSQGVKHTYVFQFGGRTGSNDRWNPDKWAVYAATDISNIDAYCR